MRNNEIQGNQTALTNASFDGFHHGESNKVRTIKYECNCCQEPMRSGNGVGLRFGNGSPKQTEQLDECSVHICPTCFKSLQVSPLHENDRIDLEIAKSAKRSLTHVLGIPESSSWEPIYEYVRDQAALQNCVDVIEEGIAVRRPMASD